MDDKTRHFSVARGVNYAGGGRGWAPRSAGTDAGGGCGGAAEGPQDPYFFLLFFFLYLRAARHVHIIPFIVTRMLLTSIVNPVREEEEKVEDKDQSQKGMYVCGKCACSAEYVQDVSWLLERKSPRRKNTEKRMRLSIW